jgi:hypothetical protein
VGDTGNWEFAAVVAAVSIGLLGLVIFTLVSIVNSWLIFSRSARAAKDASEASLVVQDLARELSAREAASLTASGLTEETKRLADLRKQAETLVEQQARLQEATKSLLEAGVLQADVGLDIKQLEASIQRLDEHMGQLAAAIAAMRRQT